MSDAVAVSSDKGEALKLKKEVFLNGSVEQWLSEISRVLQETVHDAVVNCVEDAKTLNYIDEIAQKVLHRKYDKTILKSVIKSMIEQS